MKLLYALIILSCLMSCNYGKKNASEPDTVIIPAKPNKFGVKEDCYKDRKTIKIVGNRSAKVLKGGEYGILDCYELGERYQACKLPDWAVEGTEVQISGVTKEVRENERLAGTPFLVSEIKKH